jgi:hypothetical protein
MERKSFRVAELAQRHHLSPAFIYKEISAGRLRARKAGSATIITDKDEQAWLDAMPAVGTPTMDDEAINVGAAASEKSKNTAA